MPTAEQILAGLTEIANTARPIAISWHLLLAAGVVALAAGWRPGRRFACSLLAFPIVSVAVLAGLYGNPFNAVLIGVVALALLLIAQRLPSEPVSRGPRWAWVIGVALVAFGWVYPHFLEGGTLWAYLYAAPFGLVPCPTFSAVIGFALMGGGMRSRAWSGTLAGSGLFYGLFGALRLGVHIDAVLIAGAIALGAAALTIRPPGGEPGA